MMGVIEAAASQELRLRGFDVATDSRVGSGITKPFVFDWVKTAPGQARVVAPDVTVVFLGAGDIYPLRRRGRMVDCCGSQWVAAWSERAAKMIRAWRDDSGRSGARVYWLTLPTPRDRGLAKVFAIVNRGIRRAVALAGERAAVIDFVPVFTPGGRYRRTMVSEGKRRVVRQDDGVHLAPEGARIAAVTIADALAADGLPPPRPPASPAQSGSSGTAGSWSRPTSTARVMAPDPKRSRMSSSVASSALAGRPTSGSESWIAPSFSRLLSVTPMSVIP
jgi:hypothetical protein